MPIAPSRKNTPTNRKKSTPPNKTRPTTDGKRPTAVSTVPPNQNKAKAALYVSIPINLLECMTLKKERAI